MYGVPRRTGLTPSQCEPEKTASALPGPMASRENNSAALISGNYLGARLRSRNFFHQHEVCGNHVPIATGNAIFYGVFHAVECDAEWLLFCRDAALKKLRYVFAHLVLPIRPVVAAHGAPVVERVTDSFAG